MVPDSFKSPETMEQIRTYWKPVTATLGSFVALVWVYLSFVYLPRSEAAEAYVSKEHYETELKHINEKLGDLKEETGKTNDMLYDLLRRTP